MPLSAPPLLLDAGLLVTVGLIGAAVATGEPAAFKLAIAFHMWLRIYDGRFMGWRKATWLTLVIGFFLFVAGGFLSYVLPWGQMSFWLEAKLGDAGWRVAQAFGTPSPLFWVAFGLLPWAVIVADMLALHRGRAHGRRLWWIGGLVLVVLAILGIVRDVAHIIGAVPVPAPSISAPPTSLHILPDVGMLATFAILRAVPSKPLGVALLSLVLLLPAVAAWTCGWRFHAPQTRAPWFLLSATLGASWIGLTVLGAQPVSDASRWGALALVTYQAAFFLAVPLVFGRMVRLDDRRVLAFE